MLEVQPGQLHFARKGPGGLPAFWKHVRESRGKRSYGFESNPSADERGSSVISNLYRQRKERLVKGFPAS